MNDENVVHSNFRPIQSNEAFEGYIPIVTGLNETRFRQKTPELYGEKIHQGKQGRLYKSENKVTKIFNQPNHVNNFYEFEFMRRFGGTAGLPRFYGAVPNGYQMEAVEGKSLASLMEEATKNFAETSSSQERKNALRKVISKEQAQELINLTAEYHKTTGRVHGGLDNPKNILITADNHIRFLGTEWERELELTPQAELEGLHKFLTEELGIEGLEIPETTSSEKADDNSRRFKVQVRDLLGFEPPTSDKVIGYKTPNLSAKILAEEDGAILVNTTGIISAPPPPPLPPQVPAAPSGAPPADKPKKKRGLATQEAIALAKKGVKQVTSKAGAAIGSSILPVIGTAIGNFVGREVGAFFTDPIGTTKKWLKRAAIAFAAFVGLVTTAVATIIFDIILYSTIAILLVAFILFIINSGGYLVPPGGLIPLGVVGESAFIRVEKVATPPGPFGNNVTQRITYTVTITARRSTLSNISLSDNCTVISNTPQNCPPEANIIANGNPASNFQAATSQTISPVSPYVITYERPYLSGRYNDSLITDTFTVSAEAEGQSSQAGGSTSVVFGNPPDNCPAGWPVFGRLNQGACGPFSHVIGGTCQEAVDIGANTGTDVTARHTGIARSNPNQGPYGRTVEIVSDCDGSFFSRYSHLNVISVSTGQSVTLGQKIGEIGSTGNSSGSHLHYEFRDPSGPKSYSNNPPFLMNVFGETYVPKDLPRNCTSFSGCGSVLIP